MNSPSTRDLSRPSTSVDHISSSPDSPEKGEGESFLVQFDPSDPALPKNWPLWKKVYGTALTTMLSLNSTFASSAPAGIIRPLMKHFKVSEEVATLSISVFIGGYCFGPLIWGPLSEHYGRRPVFMYPFFVYTVFQIGSALSPNITSLLIFRFVGGFFAVAPVTIGGAYASDVWGSRSVGIALAFCSIGPFAGPTAAPIISGYIQVAGVDWRWVFWILSIFAGVCFIAIIFTLEETYQPILTTKKARQIRKETGDIRYHTLQSDDNIPFAKRLEIILLKPFKVFFREPMLICIAAYLSFIYGTLYLNFLAYPVVFVEGHHLNAGESALTFLPIFIGGVCSVAAYILIYNPRYEKLMLEYAPRRPPPESRLAVSLPAAPIFAFSFFWFGWTSYPGISFWAPVMSGLFFGYSYMLLFQGMFNYIIDAYLEVAATAIATSTVWRSIIGSAFPLFGSKMYRSLNPRWGATLLGCIAILGIPIPFVLNRFGPTLRAKSRYAPTEDLRVMPEKDPA